VGEGKAGEADLEDPLPATPPRTVAVLAYDNVTMLDIAGPADVFAHATLFGGNYKTVLVSPDGSDIRTSNGLRVRPDCLPSDLGPLDVAIIPGSLGLVDRPFDPVLVAGVETMVASSKQITSVCTGSFLLAHVGGLNGRRATTHWNRIDLFRRSYPAVRVVSDALFVRDDMFVTSAGIASGIDLALSIVEHDFGPEVAGKVIRQMVLSMARSGDQPQVTTRSRSMVAVDNPLRRLLDVIAQDPAAEHTLAAMSNLASVSPRTVTRLFHEHLQTTPARYVESVRIEAAKGLLQQGSTVARAATLSGFGSAETLRRVFVNQLGVTPSVYAQPASP
jgi:transcriptional regulator GlxA family with amidase domain